MIALDDFQFSIAIHTGQYASLDAIYHYVLSIWLNGDRKALLLPKARCAFQLLPLCYIYNCFSFTGSITVKKSYHDKM